MRIMMTILIVTSTTDDTASFVIEHLENKGVRYVRLNTDQALLGMNHAFQLNQDKELVKLEIGSQSVDLSAIRSVWYRRPEEPIPSDHLVSIQSRNYATEEAYYYLRCLYAMLEDAKWVSHPSAINRANVKLHQLSKAKSIGLHIPKTLATNNPIEALSFYNECRGRIVVKPFRANTVVYDGIYATIFTSRVTKEDLSHLDSVAFTVTQFQEEIEKEYELRVTVFGDEVFATAIDSQEDKALELDWRRTSPNRKPWRKATIPTDIADKCRTLVSMYGLKFGALDFALTPKGEYVFFELNPNGQWAWQELYLGLPMTESLLNVLNV